LGKIIADLHIHTTSSDGTFSPQEIINKLENLHATHFSITDHDTCEAYEILKNIIKKSDLILIPGIEFSTQDDLEKGRRDIHMLGFYLDVNNEKIKDYANTLIEGRKKEKQILVERLQTLGYPIKWTDVEKKSSGKPIGKPHIVEPLLDNMNLTGSERYVTREKLYDFCYNQHILRQGAMTLEDTIKFIHDLGGIAVLAHPELYEEDDTVIKDSLSAGIDGIELYNKYRNPIFMQDAKYTLPFEKIKKYDDYALNNNLLVTGGSDYHGQNTLSEPLAGGLDKKHIDIFMDSCRLRGINTTYPA